MNLRPEDYARIKEIWLQAGDLAGNERRAFLERAAGGDQKLFAEVERLFAYEDDPRTPADAIGVMSASAVAEAPDCGDSLPTEMPTSVGGYRIVRPIGRGGMGIVYEAEQSQPRRRVAVKVLRRVLLDSSTSRRFELEAELLGRLQHPGIAQVIEARAGSGEAVPFIAMEYVEGVPLATWAKDATPDFAARLRLLVRLCEATHHAHLRGVIHRDLKPGNVLVMPDGSPKILDFGVARALGDDPSTPRAETVAGEVLGTVAYMSPEQAAGDPTRIDFRTDVHALGVIGYELLTGSLPHDLRGLALPVALARVQESPPVPPERRRRDLPRDVATIISTAIDPVPDRRYQTAAALASDLERYLAREPILARPPSVIYQLRLFAIRRKAAVTAGISTLVIFVVALAISLGAAVRAREAAASERVESARARAAEQEALIHKNQAARAAYAAQIRAASSAIDRGRGAEAARLLSQTEAVLRGWEWDHLASRLDTADLVLGESDDACGDVTFSANGRFVLTAVRSGSVQFRDLETYRIQKSIETGPHLASLDLSRDGRYLVTGHDGGSIELRDLETDVTKSFNVPESTASWSVRFFPAGDRVLLSTTRELRIWSVGTGACLAVKGNHCADVAPDGAQVVHSARDPALNINGFITMSDAATGERIGRVASFTEALRSFAFSPDGERIAVGTRHPGIHVLRRTTGERERYFRGRDQAVTAITWFPDGRQLATGSDAGSVDLWRVDGGVHLRSLLGLGAPVRRLVLAPDGRKIAAATETSVRVWDLAEDDDICVGRGHDSYVYDVEFAPDGRSLVTLAWDDTARLWCPWTARPRGLLTRGVKRPEGIAWSLDGNAIIAGIPNVHRFDVARGAVSREPRDAESWAGDVAWPGRVGDAAVAPGRVKIAFKETKARSELIVTDLPSGHERSRPIAPGPVAITIDRAGSRAAIAFKDSSVRIIDLATLEEIADLRGLAEPVFDVAFSPDGARLAGGDRAGEIHLWSTTSWEEIAVLLGHTGDVRSVSWSPDGTRLASASADKTIRIWSSLPRRMLFSSAATAAEAAAVSAPVVGTEREAQAHGAASPPLRSIAGGVGTGFGRQVVVVDLDGDGRPEIVAAAPETPPLQTGAVEVYDATTLERRFTIPGGHAGDRFGSAMVVLGDVDADGHPDLAVGAPGFDGGEGTDCGAVMIVSGADGRVLRTLEGTVASSRFGRHVAALDDLDGDRIPELAVVAEAERGCEVRVVSPRMGAVLRTFSAERSDPPVQAVGDADGDGKRDIALTVGSWIEVVSSGAGTVLRRIPLPAGESGRRGVLSSGDGDRDGFPEFVVSSGGGPGKHEHRVALIGAASSEPLWTREFRFPHRRGRILNAGDLDGDGFVDVAVQDPIPDDPPTPGVHPLRVLSGRSGQEIFSLQLPGECATAVLRCDLDGDGAAEQLVSQPDDSPPRLLIFPAPVTRSGVR